MKNAEYLLGVFVNHATKEFGITARKETCTSLPGMILREKARGFEYNHVARNLEKSVATNTKIVYIAAMRTAGYEHVSMNSISDTKNGFYTTELRKELGDEVVSNMIVATKQKYELV